MMNNPKGGGMMKQVMQMQKQLKQTQKELDRETVIGVAGKGAVSVIMTGSQKCKGVKLDAEIVSDISASELEKIFEKAIVDALEKSKKLMTDKLGPLSGGLSGLGFK